MKSADKLKKSMLAGRVYRRQELTGFSSAVDRDLKSLVETGDVKKLSGGLYYRPRENRFGDAPPDDRDLVRAFLKSSDFLLTSRNHYNQLGLGLTQVYNTALVYNHKRAGEFCLAGKNFEFRMVPAYPQKLSKEYLLVDMLNNLRHLPDDTELVLRNLKFRLSDFDRASLEKQLERYGRPAARRALQEASA
jgi:hypothetical protein